MIYRVVPAHLTLPFQETVLKVLFVMHEVAATQEPDCHAEVQGLLREIGEVSRQTYNPIAETSQLHASLI